MDGYEALRNAIVIQACDDLLEAYKINKRKTIKEVENFFRSDYYKTLCKIDGELIIKEMKYKSYDKESRIEKESKYGL